MTTYDLRQIAADIMLIASCAHHALWASLPTIPPCVQSNLVMRLRSVCDARGRDSQLTSAENQLKSISNYALPAVRPKASVNDNNMKDGTCFSE